jgi:hypothetical protein
MTKYLNDDRFYNDKYIFKKNIIMRSKNYLFVLLTVVSCGSASRKQGAETLHAVRLYYHLQIPKNDGTLFDLKDSLDIFRKGDYMVYKDRARYTFTNVQLNKNMDVIKEKTILDTTKYAYIICRAGHKYGFRYDSLNTLSPKRIQVDSFRHSRTIDQMPFFTKNDSLVSAVKSNKTPFLTEARDPIMVKGVSYANHKFYYYTNEFKDAPVVFSGKLDSISRMKLYKVRFVYNAVQHEGVSIPVREYLFELKKAKADPEIPKLIERFKAMEAKLGL